MVVQRLPSINIDTGTNPVNWRVARAASGVPPDHRCRTCMAHAPPPAASPALPSSLIAAAPGPAAAPAAGGGVVPAAAATGAAVAVPPPGRPRVLVADASRAVRAAVAVQLRDRFEIREVADGDAAWQAILLDASLRVMVLGLGLPKLDGVELLSRMRSSKVQRIRDLPVVVLAAQDEPGDRERVLAMGATDLMPKSAASTELAGRLDVLIKLSTTREALVESQATLESARTVDPDTELLNPGYFDKQVEKLVSYSRRNLSDVAVIALRIDLTMPQAEHWDGELEQRYKLVGRALAASIRLEDLGTRTEQTEFCVATQSTGLSGILRFAARLRKVLENVEAAGPGVEVWTSIGVATLSEELRRGAEELRTLAQKRAQQAQSSRSRRIILGASEGVAPGALESRHDEGGMDVNLALALIRAGRAADVTGHLPALLEQLSPLLKLVRQQHEIQQGRHETRTEGETRHDHVPPVPRTIDPRP
jgi:diguanylate cyclase (GGDEF)-like protein